MSRDDAGHTLDPFVARASSSNLQTPWRPAGDLVSFLKRISGLLSTPGIRAKEVVEQDSVAFFVCELSGISPRTESPVCWSFAGQVRLEGSKITACIINADYVSLFRQLGLLTNDGFKPKPVDPIKDESSENQPGQLFQLCNASRWAALTCDREGVILEVNSFFERLVGRSREELVGHPLKDYLDSGGKDGRDEKPEVCLLRGPSKVWVRVMTDRALGAGHDSERFYAFAPSAKVGRALRLLSEDRASLSRDLHDSLAQDAAALRLFLSNELLYDPGLLTGVSSRIASETQTLVNRLEGPEMDLISLPEALHKLVARYRLEHDFEIDLTLEPLPDISSARGMVVFRVTQECLRNVLLHSGVKRAKVRIHADQSSITGVVEDRGRGFEVNETDRYGIKGMRERCEILGGRFEIHASPGRGTKVRYAVPIDDRNALI